MLSLTSGLCFIFGFLLPVLRVHELQTSDPFDAQAACRWLLFFLCGLLFIVPALLLLPAWIPFRDESFFFILFLLSQDDARGSEAAYYLLLHNSLTQTVIHIHALSQLNALDVFKLIISMVYMPDAPERLEPHEPISTIEPLSPIIETHLGEASQIACNPSDNTHGA